jgi:hypothetical protein
MIIINNFMTTATLNSIQITVGEETSGERRAEARDSGLRVDQQSCFNGEGGGERRVDKQCRFTALHVETALYVEQPLYTSSSCYALHVETALYVEQPLYTSGSRFIRRAAALYVE